MIVFTNIQITMLILFFKIFAGCVNKIMVLTGNVLPATLLAVVCKRKFGLKDLQ